MNTILILSFSLCIIVHLVQGQGQFINCDFINRLDCSTRDMGTVCGSDGKDYANRCYLAQAQCANGNLHIVDDKACSGQVNPTSNPATTKPGVTTTQTAPTGSTVPLFHNHNQLLDFFCLELMHEACPTDTGKVCGTDNITYPNYCEFEKHRCSHRQLQVKNYGDCV